METITRNGITLEILPKVFTPKIGYNILYKDKLFRYISYSANGQLNNPSFGIENSTQKLLLNKEQWKEVRVVSYLNNNPEAYMDIDKLN